MRFTGLLRARQAREDGARANTERARREAAAAAERVRLYETALDSRRLPASAHAGVYAATLAARQATAASLSASIALAGLADAAVLDRVSELTDAAVRRRAVERLLERQAEEARHAEELAAQRELDDITSSRRPNRRRTDR